MPSPTRDDRADFLDGDRLLVVGDLLPQNLGDFVRFDRCHPAPLPNAYSAANCARN